MKIGFVYDVIYPFTVGGVERRNWELARRLAVKGHDVTLFGMQCWPGNRVARKEGVRLYGIGAPRPLYVRGRRSIRQALYAGYRLLLPLVREAFDVLDVSAFPYFPAFSAQVGSLIRRSCLVITWHEVWADYWFEYLGWLGYFGRYVERLAGSLGDGCVAVSGLTRRSLRKLGVRRPVALIPNGIDELRIASVLSPGSSCDILFAGRLNRHKGLDLLLSALKIIKRSRSVSCLIIGDGPESSNVDRLIGDMKIGDIVKRTGFVSDETLLALMKGSKVFASPSLREGFGITALEALACGVPVVTVRHHQNATCDLIEDGVTGFVGDPTPEGFADALLRSLDRSEEMSKNCVSLARRFNWDAITEMLLAYYQDLLQGRIAHGVREPRETVDVDVGC